MKAYKLQLKGTRKNNTPDMEVRIFGDNKSHAFNHAYKFFELGEFVAPYFANGSWRFRELPAILRVYQK